MITIEPPSSRAASGGPLISPRALRKAELARFLAQARALAGVAGEVHVLLSDDAELRRLNQFFRKKDKATDVLSFPAAADTSSIAGDLAISMETAARQAAEFGHTLQDEVKILLLHGVLHLAGYDHERDAGEMALQETKLRGRLGLPVTLIERVQGGARKAASTATKRKVPVAKKEPLAKQRVTGVKRAAPAKRAAQRRKVQA